ncbi:MAG: hypothetical protein AAF849_10435 [Bacteroidota bacterium]
MQEVKLTLTKEKDFVIEETESTICITGTNFTIPSFDEEVWGNKNLIIMGYDLSITESLEVYERNVTIVANTLTAKEGVQINVSGKNGEPFNVAAEDGRTAGAKGKDGNAGRNGTNGGIINLSIKNLISSDLSLIAKGGNGGAGQIGGSGAVGPTGGTAGDRRRRSEGAGPRGGVGGTGGAAGKGGVGGNGGSGGEINVNGVQENMTFVSKGGDLGKGGAHGKPGAGGKGGLGGRGVECRRVRQGRGTVRECEYIGRGPEGPKGAEGNSIEHPSAGGSSGKDGKVLTTEFDTAIHLGYYSISFLKMLLHEAEIEYLNKRFESSFKRLSYLEELLSEGKKTATEAVDLQEDQNEPYNEQQLTSILERTHVLLLQLAQGLDFYGEYPDYVPLTSISIYESFIDSMLDLSTAIETSYDNYYEKNQSKEAQRKSIQLAVDSLENQRDNLLLSKEQIIVEIDQGRKQIADLLEEVLLLEQEVALAKSAFVEAVSREAACGFSDILKAGAAVASIASGVGAISGGVALLNQTSEYVQRQKIKDRFEKGAKYITKHAKEVQGGFDGISKGYQDIKDIIDKERDGAKLIAAEGDFEAAVAKFENLPEAREYRRLMRQLINLNKTRNNKILETDAKITRLGEIEVTFREYEENIQVVSSRLLNLFNPRLLEYVVFFERALASAKASLLRGIVMEHKALQYWGLSKSLIPKNLQDRNIDQLKAFHLGFKDKYLRIIEDRNAVPQKISPSKMTFERAEHFNYFQLLDKVGRFSFELDTNHPSYRFYARVLINTAEVKLDIRGKNDNWIWVFLRHNGNCSFIDMLGNKHSFSHRKRDRVAEIVPGRNSTILNLGGEIGQYAYLSPFTHWTFMIQFGDSEGNPLTDKEIAVVSKKIKKIHISFKGIADTRYGSMANDFEYMNESEGYFEPFYYNA